MTQLRQFNLQFTFVGARTLCKYIQYQRGTIENSALAALLNITFLDCGERPADDYQVCTGCGNLFSHFINFSAPNKKPRVRPATRCCQYGGDFYTCRAAQFLKLVELFRSRIRKKRV